MRRWASLRGRREFALVLRRGRAASARNLIVFAFSPRRANAFSRSIATRVGIVITRKVGTAVVRNRLRRQCKAILDQSPIANSDKWYVVQCRPTAAALSYAQLREQLLQALAKSNERAGGRARRHEVAPP